LDVPVAQRTNRVEPTTYCGELDAVDIQVQFAARRASQTKPKSPRPARSKPVALGRKDWRFAGRVDPQCYLGRAGPHFVPSR